MLQTPSVFNKRNPGNPAATDSLGRKRQLAEEETGRRRGHAGRRGAVYTLRLLFTQSLARWTWRRSTSEHGRSTRARTCSRRAPGRPASGWAVRWEAWSCLKLVRDEHNCNVLPYQVKQEKAGQEQASTSPYPSSFPEALGFPSYEAAMNQYSSVSPTQGCLNPTLGLFWRKVPECKLSGSPSTTSYSGQYQGTGGQYGGQGQYGQYGSYGYAGHNLGSLQSK